MFFSWTHTSEIPRFDALVANQRLHGGALIEYQRVWSLIVFTSSSPVVVWVPPGGNRRWRGLPATIFSALLGWWSVAGFFGTLRALTTNLMGGIDVTAALVAPAFGQPDDATAFEQIEKARTRETWVFAGLLLLLLAGLVLFLVLPALREAHLL